MGMSIDEAIKQINECKAYKQCDMEKDSEAFEYAINTMRKYKKIRLIINKWNAGIYDDEGLCDVEVLEMLSDEVVEDGNDD